LGAGLVVPPTVVAIVKAYVRSGRPVSEGPVGLRGEIQGPINTVTTIDDTRTNPINVIHPAEPLLVKDLTPGMRRARIDRLISSLGNLVPPYNRILGSRYAYRISTTRFTTATRMPKKTTAP